MASEECYYSGDWEFIGESKADDNPEKLAEAIKEVFEEYYIVESNVDVDSSSFHYYDTLDPLEIFISLATKFPKYLICIKEYGSNDYPDGIMYFRGNVLETLRPTITFPELRFLKQK